MLYNWRPMVCRSAGGSGSGKSSKVFGGLGKQNKKVKTPEQVIDEMRVNPNFDWSSRRSTQAKFSPDEYRKWHQNCQRCAFAFELQMRGFDVSAAEKTDSPLDDRIGTTYNIYALFHSDHGAAEFSPTAKKTLYSSDLTNKELYGLTYGTYGARSVDPFGPQPNFINPAVVAGTATPGSTQFSDVTYRRASDKTRDAELAAIKAQMAAWGEGSRAAVTVRWTGGGGHVFNVIYSGGELKFYDSQIHAMSTGVYRSHAHVSHYDGLVRTDNASTSTLSESALGWGGIGLPLVTPYVGPEIPAELQIET